MEQNNPLRVGIGGPVGSGKTALCEMLCKRMRERYDMAKDEHEVEEQFERRDPLFRPGGEVGHHGRTLAQASAPALERREDERRMGSEV